MPRSYGTTNAAPYAVAPAVGAAGDTYFNTTSKMLFLSDGTAWIQVQSGGGGAAVLFDGFTRRSAVTTSIPTTVTTDIPLATVIDAQGATYTPDGTSARFTIPATGVYDISGQITAQGANWPAATFLALRVNGTVLVRQHAVMTYSYESIHVSFQRVLQAGDQVSLALYQQSGSTINVTAVTSPGATDGYSPQLSVWRAGGQTGPTGPTGAQGPAGTGITSAFTARGEWASATAYNPLEIVTRNGVAFLAMSANTNVDPGSLPYGSFAAISDLQAQISGIGKNLAWTPVLRQGGVVPVTINAAWYSRVGEWVIGEFDLYATGAGTGGQTILLDLPVPMRAAGGNTLLHVGTCFITAGGNTYSYALAWTGSTTQIGFAVGGTFYSTAIASGNYVNGFFLYLAPVGV